MRSFISRLEKLEEQHKQREAVVEQPEREYQECAQRCLAILDEVLADGEWHPIKPTKRKYFDDRAPDPPTILHAWEEAKGPYRDWYIMEGVVSRLIEDHRLDIRHKRCYNPEPIYPEPRQKGVSYCDGEPEVRLARQPGQGSEEVLDEECLYCAHTRARREGLPW